MRVKNTNVESPLRPAFPTPFLPNVSLTEQLKDEKAELYDQKKYLHDIDSAYAEIVKIARQPIPKKKRYDKKKNRFYVDKITRERRYVSAYEINKAYEFVMRCTITFQTSLSGLEKMMGLPDNSLLCAVQRREPRLVAIKLQLQAMFT